MQKDELFELIHSMNKSEKNLFRKHAQRHIQKDTVNYLNLFDIICKMSSYNEDTVVSKLHDQSLSKNLSRLKNYLYEQIIKFLSSISPVESAEYQIKEKLLIAEMLMERALAEHSRKYINKAKKLCHDYDIPLGHIEVNLAEIKLEYNFTINKNTKKNIHGKYDDILNQINELKIQQELNRIFIDLSISLSYTDIDAESASQFKKYENNELLYSKKYAELSIRNKVITKLITNFIDAHNKNPEKVINGLETIIELIESNQNLKNIFHGQYCHSLINLSRILMNLKRYDESFLRLEQYKKESLNKNHPTKKSSARRVNSIYYSTLLVLTIKSGKMNIQPEEMEEIQRHYEFENSHNGDLLILSYLSINLAYYLFILGEHKKCNKILNTLINNKYNLNHISSIDALILNFMNQYHLGNYDYLVSTIKLITKIIDNTEKTGYFNEVINYIMSKKHIVITHEEANELLKEIHTLISSKRTPDNFYEERIINKEILIQWIECVIKGNKFYEVLRKQQRA